MAQIKEFLRYFIKLAYFGKNFHGWQIQPNAPSVQEKLNAALSTLLQQNVNIVGAGRTDTGVHAREMYAHFDLTEALQDIPLLLNRLNKMSGPDIAVYDWFRVSDEAHARFDAQERSYEYHISRVKNPFYQDLATCLRYPLNQEQMQKAAKLLPGERDYTSFSKSNTQTHTNVCNITMAHWNFQQDYWVFHITANRFLRNMVRAIVGSLLEVGRGRMSVASFDDLIKAKDRTMAGESVPAQGLYLTKIKYPKNIING